MSKDNSGFAIIPVIVLTAIIIGAGIVAAKGFKELKNPQAIDFTPLVYHSASPSTSPVASIFVSKKVDASASPKKTSSSSPAASATTSTGSSSSTTSSSSDSNSSASSPSPTVTTTPTPTPTVSGCSSLCFDRSSASVTVTQGQNLTSGGYQADAFNLTGDGSNGYQVQVTGLPAGTYLSPTSGGFANGSSQKISVWINQNNATAFGTYTGTVTLRKGNGDGSYSDVPGSLQIAVTYKSAN